jgi:hypothetical protein
MTATVGIGAFKDTGTHGLPSSNHRMVWAGDGRSAARSFVACGVRLAWEDAFVKFLLLIYGDAAAEAAMTDDERRAIVDQHIDFARHLAEGGAHVVGEALAPPEAGRTLKFSGDGMLVTDGPFLETKEALGGFYVLEAGSIEEAAELARPIPRSPGLVAEIRPIVEM